MAEQPDGVNIPTTPERTPRGSRVHGPESTSQADQTTSAVYPLISGVAPSETGASFINLSLRDGLSTSASIAIDPSIAASSPRTIPAIRTPRGFGIDATTALERALIPRGSSSSSAAATREETRAASALPDQQALIGLNESPRYPVVPSAPDASAARPSYAEGERRATTAATMNERPANAQAEDQTRAVRVSPEGRRDRTPPRGICPRRSPSGGNSPRVRDTTPLSGRVQDEIEELTKRLKVLETQKEELRNTTEKEKGENL